MGFIKKYSAGAWVDAPIMSRGASSWGRARVFRWTGSAWKLIQGPRTTVTYNATGYETRSYQSTTKHYLRTLVSSTQAYPKHIGVYDETVQLGYLKFNWSSMADESNNLMPISAKLTASVSKDSSISSETCEIQSILAYSSSALADSTGTGYTHTTSASGTLTLIPDSENLAHNLTNAYQNSRYPYGIYVGIWHESSLSSALGIIVSSAVLSLTYES